MIIRVTPDKEKVKSIRRLIEDRIDFVKSTDEIKFPTIIAENYYEIVKELITAVFLIDGFKAVGESAHKELIEAVPRYKTLEEHELRMIDDLRIKRNKSCYEGKKIDASYLQNRRADLTKIIVKLKTLLNKKLEN